MVQRRTGVGAATLAFAAIVIVAVATFGLLATNMGSLSTSSSSSATNDESSSPSTTNSSNEWTVLKSNTTLYYGPACVPVELFALSCPTIDTASHSPSLSGVDVISYRSESLYAMNFTYDLNGQPVTHTVWFTNDTAYCVSPLSAGYALCPTHPAVPDIVITTPSTSAVNSSNALRLYLQLSNSTGGVGITVGMHNTLKTVNNVSAADNWAIPANALRDICGNYIAAYAVYAGDYGANNFTTASALVISSPGVETACSVPPASTVYSFGPDSGIASAPAGVFSPVPTSKNVTFSETISGYYTCGTSQPTFKPQAGSGVWLCDTGASTFIAFPSGSYTVVALDQWGDVTYTYFTIMS